MKKLLPILAIPALFLVGCGNNDEPEPQAAPNPETESVSPESEESIKGFDYDREIGEELQLASNPTNDVILKVTDITLGEECKYGTNDYGEEAYDLNGNQYLQVSAEVDAKNVVTDAGGDWIMLNDPEILDADGFTQSTGLAVDCQNADDGHEIWSTDISSGEKQRVYGAFEVPQGVEKVIIEGYKFDVTGL